jgi:tryptophan 2,3-dioxygenase
MSAETDPLDGAVLDMRDRLGYAAYLHLDELLGAQRPRSDAHDEMLFIIQHQATELWLRLVLHELEAAMVCLDADQLRPVFKHLARVERVFRVLLDSWDVLSTMTPADYLAFRGSLDASSGFQSFQYRMLEFVLGNREAVYLRPFEHQPALHERLVAACNAPSLYDRTLHLLARRGASIHHSVLHRDITRTYEPHDSVTAAWRTVYENTEEWWDVYELAEELVDLESALREWRFRHVTTVQRIIGAKRGTGGTSGVGYLASRLDVVMFPELWTARGEL